MENFDHSFNQENKPVKEKSIYSLNLDGTRIAILAMIVAAIIAVTFLIGMKFTGSSDDAAVPETTLADMQTQVTEPDPLGTATDSQQTNLTQTSPNSSKDNLFADNKTDPVNVIEPGSKVETPNTASNESEIKHVQPKTDKTKISTNNKKNIKHGSSAKEIKPAFDSVS